MYKSSRCVLPSLKSVGLSVQRRSKNYVFKLDFQSDNFFFYFWSKSHPDASNQVSVNWPFSSGEEAKIDFQDVGHGGHLGFLIRTIFAIFNLQVTLMLPVKFKVNWHFGSGEEAKKISHRSDFNYV